MNQNQMRIKYWSFVFFWVTCIYSTLYIVRPICEFLKETTPFTLLTNIILIILLGILVLTLWRNVKIKSRLSYLLLAIVLACYGFGLITIQYPEEKIHFMEYGLLAFLTYRALRIDFSGSLCFLYAFVLTAAFGWIDEGIQHILPNRYYQNADVILNAVSGGLGLLVTFIFQRELKNNG